MSIRYGLIYLCDIVYTIVVLIICMQRGKPLSPFPPAQPVQTINPRVPAQPAALAPPTPESSEEDELTLAEIAATKPPLKVVREFMRDQLERSEEDEFE